MGTERSSPPTTTSLCPSCLEPVPGRYETADGKVYLSRLCPEHGATSRVVWGSRDHWEWARDYGPTSSSNRDLTVDNSHACLAVIEVTQRCNLSCSYCFASSGHDGRHLRFDEIVDLLEVVLASGGPRPIQLSGGEPTIRDDIPDIVERAVELGFEHIQVNTNGLVLAQTEGYAERLADAGVTAIYLQFDGLEPTTYEAIREADIVEEKHRAIEACRRAGLPVVLVPTVVPGTNDHEMGDIVQFALQNLDVIQSVNFQPVAHFGRYAEYHGRFALDEAARRLADQIDGLEPRDLMPIPCCSAYCQMATALMPDGDGGVVPLTQFISSEMFDSLSGMVDESDWMELLAGTPTGSDRACSAAGCCGVEVPGDATGLLESVLPVSLTGFMDADAADMDRLGNCCISVPTPSGELVPFCAYNMTTEDGRYALRNRHGWGGRSAVNRTEPAHTDIVSDGSGTPVDLDSSVGEVESCCDDYCCGGG